jgi:hypothetical protein
MDRVRRAGQFALFVAFALSLPPLGFARPVFSAVGSTVEGPVMWPTSTLLVSEVVTGGASASDEFAELANAGNVPVDVSGYELVYATSSGGTVARKAAWTTPTVIGPGRHLLVANVAGVFATIADATYSGGFAATGGTVALRPIGGAVVDAVGWGDASNGFVEGLAAPSPASGSSIERLPGGSFGNATDSNDNAADFVIRTTPSPQNLVADPRPEPGPSCSVAPTATPSAVPTATPTPTATISPTPIPTATPTPQPTPTATPSPSPSPSPSPDTLPIGDARRLPIGTTVNVVGLVTAEAGRLGAPDLVAIQDPSGGVFVRIPDGVSAPGRGARLEVRGRLAEPYGQLEIRPPLDGMRNAGSGPLPEAVSADASSFGESLEGRLVTIHGRIGARPTRSSSGDISFNVATAGGQVRIVADGSSGLTADSVTFGATYDIVGVAGQRASRKGAVDGYRVWSRDAGDLRLMAAPTPSSTPTPAPSGSRPPSPSPRASSPPPPASVVTIADAIRRADGQVVVEGLVTTRPDFLDATGRRIVIEDRTAGVELLIPTDATAPGVGTRIRVEGTIGWAYDAPRVKAERIVVVAIGARPLAMNLQRSPSAADEWRLVRVTGSVVDVKKLGDRWRAELSVGSERVVVSGLAGARIPATTLAAGRVATVVGIMRRPYPGASDRRWSIAPRNPADVVVGAPRPSAGNGTASGGPFGRGGTDSQSSGSTAAPDVDLVDLAGHLGTNVRVGGLVTELNSDGFLLDDGTAVGRIALQGAAAEYLPLLEPGDALNASGRVLKDGTGYRIVVDDPANLVRVGDPTLDPAPSAEIVAQPAVRDPNVAAAAGRLAAGPLGPASPGTVGILGFVLISVASVAITLLRRRHARRIVAARMVARLAEVGSTHWPD